MIPKFLYHGTTAARHDSIAENGLLPRCLSRIAATCVRNPNVGPAHAFGESSPDHIYLTSAYPLFFAEQALHENDVYKTVIYEINTELLEQDKFCADEDVLILWLRQAAGQLVEGGVTGDKAISMFLQDHRKDMHKVSAERSLEAMGTCAYRGRIPLYAIRRALFISLDATAELIMRGMDPVINLQNYAILGKDYEESVQWMFKETQSTGVLKNPTWNEKLSLWENPRYRMQHAQEIP
jgi:hypothetical protein